VAIAGITLVPSLARSKDSMTVSSDERSPSRPSARRVLVAMVEKQGRFEKAVPGRAGCEKGSEPLIDLNAHPSCRSTRLMQTDRFGEVNPLRSRMSLS